MSNTSGGIGCGTVIGIVLAMFLSWQRNHSILWAIVAGVFNWLYVLYFFVGGWGLIVLVLAGIFFLYLISTWITS